MPTDILAGSLVAYFVVFFKNGFTPSDLRTAQKALTATPSISELLATCSKVYPNRQLAYFEKSSPDFINSRGETISASKQVDALAQAQSIGW